MFFSPTKNTFLVPVVAALVLRNMLQNNGYQLYADLCLYYAVGTTLYVLWFRIRSRYFR